MANQGMFIPCFTCTKEFTSVEALKQHKKALMHFTGPRLGEVLTSAEALKCYFDAYDREKVMILRNDRRKSRKVVQKEIKGIMQGFQYENGADFYSDKKPENAGSTATQTKVYLADEYDFNIMIDVDPDDLEILTYGRNVHYQVEEGYDYDSCHLANEKDVEGRKRRLRIPSGYAAVRVNQDLDYYEEKDWWDQLTFKKFLIPRKVQEDLYTKTSDALEDNEDTKVSCRPHGPAITLTVDSDEVEHHISVDFVAALKTNLRANHHGWPRQDTYKCIPQNIIQLVLEQQLYLVPKRDDFWYISFGNAAKVLLRSIDAHDECRIQCHRLLKRDFMKWKSEASYPGISTYMFKNHLFWYCEQVHLNNDDPSYWNENNIGQCYMDFLLDFAERLESEELLNYFNPQEDILLGKDTKVLNSLANKMRQRRNQLKRIVAV